MPASTDTEAEALAWVDLLGAIAASCDLYAAHAELQVNWTAVREGDRSRARDLDELASRAAKYRDLQLAALHNISIDRHNSFTINR